VSSVLNKILRTTRLEVENREKLIPIEKLKNRNTPIRDIKSALRKNGVSIIAEIKRKSPSQGIIRDDIDPVQMANIYQENDASAISVLTDEPYFGGNLNLLQEIRASVELPILRKDFIVSEYQVYESYHAGADAILLIAEALSPNELFNLYSLATSLGLHVLVEGYTNESIKTINELKPEIIGINARNLDMMEVDFNGMLAKRELLPRDAITVAESGVQTPAQITKIYDAGYDAALIGTSLMKSEDPGKLLQSLINESESNEVLRDSV